VKNNILDIEKDRGFVEYIQDIVGYLLGFLALVGVLYLIYAGLSLIFGAGSEEHSKKLRKTIFGIIIGILLIFLAYPIVMFIIRAVSPDSTSTSGSGTTGFFRLFSPEITYAADVNQTFDDYRKQIEKFVPVIQREYKLNGAISISTLDQLRVLVE
jgi:type IV secretory pathway VirB2 component (pilin)